MKLSLASTILIPIALVSGNDLRGSMGGGPGGLPGGPPKQAFVNANQHPNDTSSVKFNRYGANVKPEEGWIWRVNITEIPLPKNPDMHVVNTVYDLQWPGGGNLKDFLTEENNRTANEFPESPLCITAMSFNLSSHVTAKDWEQNNGTCAALLGDECVQSLMESFEPAFSDKCASPRVFGDLKGCNATLNPATDYGAFTMSLGTQNATLRNLKNESINSGEAVFYRTSAPFAATNRTQYTEAEGHVQILALTGLKDGRFSALPSILCQVVNKTAIESGAIPSWHAQSGVALWALVAFGAFATLL